MTEDQPPGVNHLRQSHTSAPGAVPHRTSRDVEDEVFELRRRHGWGPDRLSSHTGVPSTTCWRIIHRRNCTGPGFAQTLVDTGCELMPPRSAACR